MYDSTLHVRWWNDWLWVPPWWAVGAFKAGNASCSSLLRAPHTRRKSVNGVWVILNFHEHIKGKSVGGRGWGMLWRTKLAHYKNLVSIEVLYIFGQFSTLLSSSAQPALAKGHARKAGCFFPLSSEAAWRLRIACLKVTWFLLKC